MKQPPKKSSPRPLSPPGPASRKKFAAPRKRAPLKRAPSVIAPRPPAKVVLRPPAKVVLRGQVPPARSTNDEPKRGLVPVAPRPPAKVFLRKPPAQPRLRKPLPKPPTKENEPKLKTLDRVLSKAGLGSRAEARSWIGTGRVKVNGKLIQTPDHWVDLERDEVSIDNKPIGQARQRYILLYKPKGYITTYKDPENRPTVYALLPGVDQFVGTAGRLDMDTSGLLLLTNDNALAEAMTNPEYKLEKTYLVKAANLLSDEQLNKLAGGIELSDGPTRPATVTRVRDAGKHSFLEITITEGRNRQVRRMLEAIGSSVLKLVRVRLGPLTLEGLSMGGWRELTASEVGQLRSLTRGSRPRIPAKETS